MTERRGRILTQLLDEMKEKKGFSKLKEEALDRTDWRNQFGGSYGSLVRLGKERTKERKESKCMIERIN